LFGVSKANGRAQCQSADHLRKGAFQPVTATPAQYKVNLSFRRLDPVTPFVAPVTIDVAQGGITTGIDRVGSISPCTANNAGLTCRVP